LRKVIFSCFPESSFLTQTSGKSRHLRGKNVLGALPAHAVPPPPPRPGPLRPLSCNKESRQQSPYLNAVTAVILLAKRAFCFKTHALFSDSCKFQRLKCSELWNWIKCSKL
jgi:hypothetical protein